jgi:WXXGXW repeat (2 copies)
MCHCGYLYIESLQTRNSSVNQTWHFWVNVALSREIKEIFMFQIRKLGMLSGLVAATVVLTGCIIAPPLPPAPHQLVRITAGTPTANVEYVQSEPPAPLYETVTVSPGVGYVWMPGLWYWSGGRHVWRSGVWQRPPAGYRTWNNGGWYHSQGRGWYHSGGYWR